MEWDAVALAVFAALPVTGLSKERDVRSFVFATFIPLSNGHISNSVDQQHCFMQAIKVILPHYKHFWLI